MTALERHTSGRATTWAGSMIDTDVHVQIPALSTLFPYMDQMWIDWCDERKWKGSPPTAWLPGNSARACRPQWRPAHGVPASDLALVREHILDAWDLEYAVISCDYGVDAIRHPDLAAALARAVNDWTIDQWLGQDSRLRASLVMPSR